MSYIRSHRMILHECISVAMYGSRLGWQTVAFPCADTAGGIVATLEDMLEKAKAEQSDAQKGEMNAESRGGQRSVVRG